MLKGNSHFILLVTLIIYARIFANFYKRAKMNTKKAFKIRFGQAKLRQFKIRKKQKTKKNSLEHKADCI